MGTRIKIYELAITTLDAAQLIPNWALEGFRALFAVEVMGMLIDILLDLEMFSSSCGG